MTTRRFKQPHGEAAGAWFGAGGGWIYTSFFSLKLEPFSLAPDTAFYYDHGAAQMAFNTLLFATRIGEGFIKVTGEVGTGKTLLCRKYLRALERDQYITAYIPNPYLEPMTLLLAIADELGVDYPDNVSQHRLLKNLTQFLIDAYARQRKAVIVVLDEAHALPIETLEALRLLSNLETSRRKLLQLVLFGQPELDQRLSEPSIRQLKQRIAFSETLAPLGVDEVKDYIDHRLSVAGYQGPGLFTPRAVKTLHKVSGGIPRLVNILAHKAMLAAFGEGRRRIEPQHVRHAARDTESSQSHDSSRGLLQLFTAAVVSVSVLWSAWMRRYWD